MRMRAALLLIILGGLPIVPFLQACQTTPSERQETRQETRVEGRTQERQEARRGW